MDGLNGQSGGYLIHQLIILGNGFDLTCGLKSKFSDFYSNRTNGTNSIETIPENKRNAWDVVLSEIRENDPLWCNIESLISAYVFQEGGSGSILDSMYGLTGLAIDISGPNPPLRPKDVLYEFVSARLGKEYVSQKELTNFLLTSLKDFEHIFASYLEEQVDNNKKYGEKAVEYYAAIRNACIDKAQQKNYETSILNFNYTTPLKSEDQQLGIVAVRNIHGSLDRTDTIFGIDGKDVAEDHPALPFTKTYRLMSLVPYESETAKLCDSNTVSSRYSDTRFLGLTIPTSNRFLTPSIYTVELLSLYFYTKNIQNSQIKQLMSRQFAKICTHAYRIFCMSMEAHSTIKTME